MAKGTVRIGAAIDAELYRELVAVAKRNGQSRRHIQAIERYIHTVVPSQRLVRPEGITAHRRSNEKFRELYQRLAK
jgi:hypothetical protein